MISRAPAPQAAWKTSPPVDSSASAIEAAAASKTPAAVRTMPSITDRKPSVASMLVASDAPWRVLSGRPSASANAAALEMRRSGMNSMPARSAVSSAGETLGVAADQRRAVGIGRRRAGDQRHQRDREAEDVGALGDAAAAEDLGRHEARRADGDRPVARLAQLARDAEVDEHDAAVGHDQVLRLDVAVDDVLLVDVVQRLARLAAPLDDLVDRQPGRALGREAVVEALALDQLHDDVVVAGVAEVVDDAHDARVVELGQQPRLDLEARDVRRVEQALDGDEAPGLAVERAVDRAHRAARDGALDRVMAAHHGSRIAGRHGPSIAVGSRAPWSGSRSSRSSSCHISWGTTCCRPTGRRVHKRGGLGPDPGRAARARLPRRHLHARLRPGADLARRRPERSRPSSACAAGIAIPHLDPGRRPPARPLRPAGQGLRHRRLPAGGRRGRPDDAHSSPSSRWRCWPRAECGLTHACEREQLPATVGCLMCAAARDAVSRLGDRGEMSAVGELVQGERRGRWLVAAVACAAALAWAAAPARAADAVDPRHAADHLRQRQRPAAGRVRRQRDRRVLPAVAGAGERGAERRRRPQTAPSPLTVYGFRAARRSPPACCARRVTGDGSAGNPWVLDTSYTTDTPDTNLPIVVNETAHLRQRHDGRRRPLHAGRTSPTTRCTGRALRGRRTSTSPATTPGVGFLDPGPPRPGRRHQRRPPGSSARLVEQSRRVGPLPGGRATSDVFGVVGSTDTGALQRHDRSRRSSTTASACSGTSPTWPRNAPGQTFHVIWRFSHFSALDAQRSPPAQVTGQDRDGHGDRAQRRRQPGSRALGALRDRRRQPGRRRGDDGRRRDRGDHVGRDERSAPTR